MFKISSPTTFILLHFSISRMVWPQNAKKPDNEAKTFEINFFND